jgi:Fe2+ transport system protein FeoA
MTLDQAPLGATATVVAIGGERSFRRRLMELGLLPGAKVAVVRVAPLGDPLELRLHGSSLSIRRREAGFIAVEPIVYQAPALAPDVTVARGATPARPSS